MQKCDIDEIMICLVLSKNKRIIHLEDDIFSNEVLQEFYLRQLCSMHYQSWFISEIENESASELAYYYAHRVLNDRWVVAEKLIASNAQSAYYYSLFVIKGRWLLAEPAISCSSEYSYRYARDIIKGRWPEAELAIFRRPEFKLAYELMIKISSNN